MNCEENIYLTPDEAREWIKTGSITWKARNCTRFYDGEVTVMAILSIIGAIAIFLGVLKIFNF